VGGKKINSSRVAEEVPGGHFKEKGVREDSTGFLGKAGIFRVGKARASKEGGGGT